VNKSVGEVAIDVTADIGPLIKEAARGRRAVEGLGGSAARLGGGLQSLGGQATALGKKLSIVSAGMAAVAGSAFLLTKRVADGGNASAKAARQVGVSADYFQEMAYAMGQVTNMSGSELESAMQRLNRTLGEAADGSQQAIDAFAKIGISQAEIASGAVAPEDAMNALIAALSKLEDPALSAAIANDLMGRTGAKLGGQLYGAADSIESLRQRAHDLGIVMGDDALAASEQFVDGMDDLGRGFEALKMKIGNELLPIFVNKLIPAMTEQVIPAIGQIVEKVADLINWFGGLPEPVQEAAGVIALALGVGGPILMAVGAAATAIGALVGAAGPIGLLITAASLIVAAWQVWGDDIKAIVGTAVEFITTRITSILEFFAGVRAKMREMGANIVAGLLAGINEQWEALKARILELGDLLPNWLRERLGIKSPSRVFMAIGDQIGQGLALGVAQSEGLVRQSIEGIASDAAGSAQGMVGDVLGAATKMFQGSKKIALAQAAINIAQGITEALKLPFPANFGAMAKVAVAGAKQMQSIRSTNIGSSGVGSGAVPAGGAVAAQPALSSSRVYEVNFSTSSPLERTILDAMKPYLNDILNEAWEDGARARLV